MLLSKEKYKASIVVTMYLEVVTLRNYALVDLPAGHFYSVLTHFFGILNAKRLKLNIVYGGLKKHLARA